MDINDFIDSYYEPKIKELEGRQDKFYEQAKKVLKRLDDAETRLKTLEEPTTKANLKSDAWTKDEIDYLKLRLTKVEKLRPIILTMEEEWLDNFGRSRSYDAIRKKWQRVNK